MYVDNSVKDQYADKVIDRAVDGYNRTSLEGSGLYVIYHIEKAINLTRFPVMGHFVNTVI